MTTLHIFSGLPASGKTTLAMRLTRLIGACYVRIDTVKQALSSLFETTSGSEGYRLSYRIVEDNLRLGTQTVADSCNTASITREAWEQVAAVASAKFVNIEIECSDLAEHQARVESRVRTAGTTHGTPSWQQVQSRDYDPWHKPVITIDTADRTVQQSFDQLRKALGL